MPVLEAVQQQDFSPPTRRLNIVIPMFNESEIIANLFFRLENVTKSLPVKTEVILIDDGSTDSTCQDIFHYTPANFDINVLTLSRNFGKEAALSSGLLAVKGDAVIILDADCQDPPELIPDMLEAYDKGADVVYMKRRSRDGESWLKRKTSTLYYRILSKMSDTPIPENVGDFRLLSRRVVDEVNQLSERNRYMKGLLSWPGFKQVTIEYDREARKNGQTKWNYWQLIFLAVNGITAFSNKPLMMASWMGASVALSAFVYGVWVLFRTLVFGDPVSGYPSLMLVILFLGGVQLITIGVLGEYIGRIFTEVKNRPNYIIRESHTREGSSCSSRLKSI